MRSKISAAAELAGLALIACGLYLLAPWLGITAGGVGLVAIGVLAEITAPAPGATSSGADEAADQ